MNNGIMEKVNKREKLERPERVAELDPAGTLSRIGLKDGDTVCDIGAGSGIFTTAAARLTRGTVYAVDTDADIIDVIKKKAESEGLKNVQAAAVSGFFYGIAPGTVDLALMVTVLHEIADKAALLDEIGTMLAGSGRTAVVEFKKEDTPSGPPVVHRIGEDETEKLFSAAGFRKTDAFYIGENFYCHVYAK